MLLESCDSTPEVELSVPDEIGFYIVLHFSRVLTKLLPARHCLLPSKPAGEVIIDECLKGWKELEYEVVPRTEQAATKCTP